MTIEKAREIATRVWNEMDLADDLSPEIKDNWIEACAKIILTSL